MFEILLPFLLLLFDLAFKPVGGNVMLTTAENSQGFRPHVKNAFPSLFQPIRVLPVKTIEQNNASNLPAQLLPANSAPKSPNTTIDSKSRKRKPSQLYEAT